jgi:hypothetical protein
VYVTADAMLYLWYETHREAMQAAEKQVLAPLLLQFVEELQEAARHPAVDETDRVTLAVVRKLLEPGWDVPSTVAEHVSAEVHRVLDHVLVEPYPGEDYTQYQVRGYYADDPELQRYFRGAKYLGRRYYRVEDAASPAQADVELRRAAALALALRSTPAEATYRDLQRLRHALIGPEDTISLLQVLEAGDNAYGADWRQGDLRDLTPLREELTGGDYPRTLINNRFTDPDLAVMPQYNAAILGEHYLPDSELFGATTEPAVTDRHLPTGLEVAAWLGSDAAQASLERECADFPDVPDIVENFAPGVSELGLYGDWTKTLEALFERPEGLPEFARRPTYEKKQINCALTSWAHLRHNFILYGAQPYAYASASRGTGIVEPLPGFFAQYADMAEALHQVLSDAGVKGRGVDSLPRLADKARFFGRVAEAQLAGADTSWADHEIKTFGSSIRALPYDTPLVVADVCTSSFTEEVLHAGSGSFHPIIAMVRDSEGWYAAVGYVGTYYEFSEPNMGRLNDDQWRIRCSGSVARPLPPEWLRGLYTPDDADDVAHLNALAKLEASLLNNDDTARQALQDFMDERKGTRWEAEALLVLVREAQARDDLQAVADLGDSAGRLTNCAAKDDAVALTQRASSTLKWQAERDARKAEFQEKLAATDPVDGLSRADEIARQDERAALLLGQPRVIGALDSGGIPLDELEEALDRVRKECPESGYVPFVDLAQAIIVALPPQHEHGFGGGGHVAPERAVRALEAVAGEYEDSHIGLAAQVAALCVRHQRGESTAVFHATAPLVAREEAFTRSLHARARGDDAEVDEPYPASEALLVDLRYHADYHRQGLTTHAEAVHLMAARQTCKDATVEGDYDLARQAYEALEGDRHQPHWIMDAIDWLGHEPEALRDYAPLLVRLDDEAHPSPAFGPLVRDAVAIAEAHPGSKTAREALFATYAFTARSSNRDPERTEWLTSILLNQYPDTYQAYAVRFDEATEADDLERASTMFYRFKDAWEREGRPSYGDWAERRYVERRESTLEHHREHALGSD